MDYGQFIDIENIGEGERNREYENWYTTQRYSYRQRNEDEGFIVLLKMIVQLCKMFGL